MRAGIALGSNLGDRMAALHSARESLRKIAGIAGPFLSSSIYETAPVDSGPEAGYFLNAVVEVAFEGDPAHLLVALQAVELDYGRPIQRSLNEPRTIDLDILYIGNQCIHTPGLVIPHPRLHLRRFVLEPLAEIAPSLRLPRMHQSIAELLGALNDPADVRRAEQQWNCQWAACP